MKITPLVPLRPRIRLHLEGTAGLGVQVWVCFVPGRIAHGYGITPALAYRAWHAVVSNWPDPLDVQGHSRPPRPIPAARTSRP